SAYSNKAFSVKRAEFLNHPQLQAMKLAHAFKYLSRTEGWGSKLIERHQAEVIRLIREYYMNRPSK
ncbi:MAG: hypothetical protein OXT49_02580, partial [Gammaproteobacteria bacterium]|nr:hypothetical protein [Gammaproteobacteria bacterium]